MADPAVAAAADQGPDWSSLPAGVLRHIFLLNTTWQTPGSCLAAPVCRSWRSAAEGCRDIRLLYRPRSRDRSASFAAWLARNSPQLEALNLLAFKWPEVEAVIEPLVAAAAAAAAAGCPLPLRTLRLLGHESATLQLTGQLLAVLPNLRTLSGFVRDVVGVLEDGKLLCARHTPAEAAVRLAPLKQATQLQELYLRGPCTGSPCGEAVAQLLPTSLRRLAWRAAADGEAIPDLSHLSRLTFLQLLRCWDERTLVSSKLPPGLQQLQLHDVPMSEEVLEGVKEVLVGFGGPDVIMHHCRRIHPLSKVQTATIGEMVLSVEFVRDAVDQLPDVSTLTVGGEYEWLMPSMVMNKVVPTAARLPGLKQLFLDLPCMPSAAGLAALTGLTRLSVTLKDAHGFTQQQQDQWAEQLVGLPALKWLSVPGQLLLVEQPWLGGLQQLRVLVLGNLLLDDAGDAGPSMLQRVLSWLEGCGPGALPSCLLLLGFTGVCVPETSSSQLYRRVRQQLSSGGCEVVDGPNLELVGNPVEQLAGLPEALQQALLA